MSVISPVLPRLSAPRQLGASESLRRVRLGALVAAFSAHRVTGQCRITAEGHVGGLAFVDGAVVEAWFADVPPEDALERLLALDGERLALPAALARAFPELLRSARSATALADRELPELMRTCERDATSCELVVCRGRDRAVVRYERGQRVSIELGDLDAWEALAEIVRWRDGFAVVVPTSEPGLAGAGTPARRAAAHPRPRERAQTTRGVGMSRVNRAGTYATRLARGTEPPSVQRVASANVGAIPRRERGTAGIDDRRRARDDQRAAELRARPRPRGPVPASQPPGAAPHDAPAVASRHPGVAPAPRPARAQMRPAPPDLDELVRVRVLQQPRRSEYERASRAATLRWIGASVISLIAVAGAAALAWLTLQR
jgi:hypothetical protein